MRYLLLFVLFTSSLSAFSQEYNFQRFSIEEGLPRSGVYDIYEDTNGFLWIATEGGGLSVFDGKTFHSYTTEQGLISNTVRCIYEDNSGLFWLGTDKGISCFDGHKFINFNEKQGLPKKQIRDIQEDKEGNLFFATLGGGLCKLKEQITDSSSCFDYITTKNGLLNDKVRCLLLDSKGGLWIGTDGGASKMNGKLFQHYTTEQGLASNKILTIFQDKSHNIWFGTKGGASELKGNQIITYTKEDGLIANRIKAISQDYIGNIWFGTKDGASYFNGTKFKNISEKNGLSNNRIRIIKRDRSHNLWFGTYFGGVNKYMGETFINYTTHDGLANNQVYAITGQFNNLIVGTFEKAKQFKASFANSLIAHDIPALENIHSKINTLQYDPMMNLWIGTNDGVHIFNQEKEQARLILKNDSIGSEVFTLYQDDDFVLAGTDQGIYKIHYDFISKKISAEPFFVEANTHYEINSIQKKDDGHYFVATQQNGLLEIDNNGKFVKSILEPKILTINSVIKDHFGRYWCASEDHGVICIDSLNNYNIYNEKNGLHSHYAHLLIFDNHDDLWVGYENGVDKIQFDTNGELTDIYHFGKDEGFVGIETNKNAVYKDFVGRIWFGTIKGAICYNPHAERINNTPPITHILDANFSSRDSTIEFHKFHYNRKEFNTMDEKSMVFPHDFNDVSFMIKGINLSIPHKVKYQWKLDGYDEDWVEPSFQEVITYTNLPYGKYKLLVKACNENEVWNKKPEVLSFEITSPFWMKNWFYLLVVAFVFGLSQIGYQWRMRSLAEAKKALEDQVKVRTQELEVKTIEIQSKHKELEIKNQSITDSINYAKRIQQAVMSPKHQHKFSIQEDVFILYKPRDIVSGDFYWFAEHESKTYVVAADCTGHGVPGAFMSMLGITFFNQLVNEEGITNAGEILDKLRCKIVASLNTSDEQSQADGMDLSLLIFDFNTNTVQYSGANNPLLYIKNKELQKIKADKMPIGISDYMEKSFTTHTLSFEKGDSFYIFSDGYPDQFGGELGKKYLIKRFKETLLDIHEKPIAQQKNILDNTIEDWRGDNFQVDDILVIGIRV
ncbi:MAG: SpoIIE family protein phosphatase [Cytophagales bacterium]|nr:SpoIIE family protein phosphatase [Cytophagales bacterium]